MIKEGEHKKQPAAYYGKKAYRIHPMLARLKAPAVKLPDYRNENIDEDMEE